MTTSSSALLFISPKGAGPFFVPAWRIGTFVELAEGGSNGPYWIIRDPDQTRKSYLPLQDLDEDRVVSSIALLLAGCIGDANLEGLLLDTHNLSLEGDTKDFAPYWDLSDADQVRIFHAVQERVRIGINLLDENSLITESVIARLRAFHIHVTLFAAVSDRDDS
jgi:hypothetical protein